MHLKNISIVALFALAVTALVLSQPAAEAGEGDATTDLERAIQAAPRGYTIQHQSRAGKPKELVICLVPATDAPIRALVWVHVGTRDSTRGTRKGAIRLDDGRREWAVAPLGFEEVGKGNPSDIHQYLVTIPAGFKGGHLNMTWSGSDWALAAVQQFIYTDAK